MEERQLRMLGVLVVVMLALTLAVNLLGEPEETFDPEATEEIWSVQMASTERFELERAEGKLVFEREGKGWRMLEPTQALADNYAVQKLLTDITHIDKGIPLPDLDAEGVQLGDPPRARVTLTDKEGKVHTLDIGMDAPVGYRAYVKAPSGVVAAVDAQFKTALHELPSTFRDKSLIRFDAGAVRRVRIASPGGVLDVHGQGKVWWLEGFGRADADKVDDLITGLLRLQFKLIQDVEPVPMDDPVFAVDVETTDATLTFHVGDRTPMGQVVHVLGGSGGMVEPQSLSLLGQGPVDIGDDHAIPAWPHRLSSVVVSLAGEGFSLEKDEKNVWRSNGEPEPRADAWLLEMAKAAVHYRREPVPELTETWGTVVIDHNDAEPFTISFGQVVDGTYRATQDSRGGDPYLVPVADLDALAAVAAE